LAILYFDCFSGAAGDMILGALIDAGVPLDEVRRALGSLAIAPDTVWTERVTRAGVSATKFSVRGEGHPIDHAHDHERGHDHDHHHHHGDHDHHDHGHGHEADEERHHHVHRTLADIFRLIDGSALSGAGKDRAKALFQRLGEAEAAIHDMPIDRVHLHEVGALDSIIDIVGSVHALEFLGADRYVASPLNVGGGMIHAAHGVYPVPAPATLRLLHDAPIYSGPQQVELVTPTGALLVTAYAEEFGPVPPMRVRKVGYGAGTRDFAETPNVLRVLIGDADAASPSHTVVVIEAEIDDMNPQIFGIVMDRLLGEGALDVFYTSIQMKKNRPGTLLTIVAAPDLRQKLTDIVFRETTTIGVRYREMRRECLDRETITVTTPLGPVRFKIARRAGEVLNASAEFDDCAAIAAATGRPLKDVQAAAVKAYLEIAR
jgi:pyridinium-3,5-bisthiocarboxylic acid mononucleotide nickel chelatase